VKLTLNVAVMPLPPDTVTVAVYVLAESPVLGVTVNVSVPLTTMPVIDVFDSVKLPALVPPSATVSAPVA